jgi:hypothetical protein
VTRRTGARGELLDPSDKFLLTRANGQTCGLRPPARGQSAELDDRSSGPANDARRTLRAGRPGFRGEN